MWQRNPVNRGGCWHGGKLRRNPGRGRLRTRREWRARRGRGVWGAKSPRPRCNSPGRFTSAWPDADNHARRYDGVTNITSGRPTGSMETLSSYAETLSAVVHLPQGGTGDAFHGERAGRVDGRARGLHDLFVRWLYSNRMEHDPYTNSDGTVYFGHTHDQALFSRRENAGLDPRGSLHRRRRHVSPYTCERLRPRRYRGHLPECQRILGAEAIHGLTDAPTTRTCSAGKGRNGCANSSASIWPDGSRKEHGTRGT